MKKHIIVIILLILGMFPHAFCSYSFAASGASVQIDAITISPATIAPNEQPDIYANIKNTIGKNQAVMVIAVLTRPDRSIKSWRWSDVVLSPRAKKTITLPRDYDTRLGGVYKIEFVIYSADMSKRIHALSRTFTVLVPSKVQPGMEKPVLKEQERKPAEVPERTSLGIGLYGNTLNPAGGATVMLWPFRNIGFQGIYTVGEFTSYEGRVLFKLERRSGWNPYLGAGYLHVSVEKDVMGVTTTFEDSTVSAVAGIEIPLGKRGRGYIEVAGAGIKLEKDIVNNVFSGHAEVEYAPVTIGIGLVWSVL